MVNCDDERVSRVFGWILKGKFKEKTNSKKDTEDQALVDEREAYQAELYYYVDPNIIDRDNPTKQMPFTKTRDAYLDFEKETSTYLILAKGESGAGISLVLRYLEQQLLKNRTINQVCLCQYISI